MIRVGDLYYKNPVKAKLTIYYLDVKIKIDTNDVVRIEWNSVE